MFATAVRGYRLRLGFSQEELASRTGLSVRTVGKLEAGRIATPRSATVRLLADVFGLRGEERDQFCDAANPPLTPVAHAVAGAGPRGRPAMPAQLPADVPSFTGRRSELDRLSALVGDEDGGRAVIVTAIGGTAGVGKTALAIHWAHLVRSRFPDGQLYVNLRGYDAEQPVSAADALAGFLRALGLPGNEVPLETAERAAAYRSLLDGRRILVVLDNASAVEQVRPLLPGSATCAAVVTSRDSLGGLVARDGASRIDLDLLPPGEAVGLLGTLVGARVVADQAAAAALARQCAHLPLALRVAAELAVGRPGAPLASLVEELADKRSRLELLDAGGDARTGVSAVLSWSYRQLSEPAARMFRLLGAHPGMEFDRFAAAALADISLREAANLLRRLAQASLIQPVGVERHGMHDLLRAYANLQAEANDSIVERKASVLRLLDHYQAVAAAAMDTLHPSEPHRRPRLAAYALPVPDLSGPVDALAWLEVERPNLLAISAHAAHSGSPEHSIRLGLILFRHLDVRAYYPDALRIHGLARDAARTVGDLAAESRALTNLGVTYGRLGRMDAAADVLTTAADLGRRAGNVAAEHLGAHNLACVYYLRGEYARAVQQFRYASDLGAADLVTEAGTHTNIGGLYFRLGEYDLAVAEVTKGLRLSDQIGMTHGQVQARSNLADINLRLGRYDAAADALNQGLVIARDGGDRIGESLMLATLGMLNTAQGRPDAAVDLLRLALVVLRDAGFSHGEAHALSHLGVALDRRGEPTLAIEAHERALDILAAASEPGGESECRNRYAETLLAAGRAGRGGRAVRRRARPGRQVRRSVPAGGRARRTRRGPPQQRLGAAGAPALGHRAGDLRAARGGRPRIFRTRNH